MERIMTDREFIVWLSGYIDAKPEAVDENIKKQLDKQVVSVIRSQLLDALRPAPGDISAMPYNPPGKYSNPIAGQNHPTMGRMVGSSVAWTGTATPEATAAALQVRSDVREMVSSVGHTTVNAAE